MLKAALNGEKNGNPHRILILGLSHLNLDRLRQGRPIAVDGAELGVPGIEIFIFSGETEAAMSRDLGEFIGPETAVKIDPRLRDA